MVIITNSLGILGGAVVLAMSLINAYFPSVVLDALLVKNLIYFVGHVFINATIYMAVIAVHEPLPRYSGGPRTVSRPFLWGWAATTIMVLIVYPHHLMMDYVMPRWMLVMGQVISYTSGLPVDHDHTLPDREPRRSRNRCTSPSVVSFKLLPPCNSRALPITRCAC